MDIISPTESTTLIIGVGNEYRGDDAVGLIVARRLKELGLDRVKVLEESGEGTALMESWKNGDKVTLIDAVHSGARPGTIHRLDPYAKPIPTKFFHYSTHAFGVPDAIELARALNKLPQQLIIYGIEGKSFEAGVGLSLEVDKAAIRVVRRVLRDVRLNSHITQS